MRREPRPGPRLLVAAIALVAATAGAVACGTAGDGPERAELVVFGAASLRDALEAIRTRSATIVPGVELTVSTDSSTALRAQIEQGAPADVFLAADTANPAALAAAGLTDGTPVPFAANVPVVVVPADGSPVAGVDDLAAPGVRVIAAGSAIPITTYAEALVAELARRPGAPPGFAAGYAANVVSREDNVRAILAKIELGEGDAGIVYATDAAASDRVRIIETPPGIAVEAVYAGVVVAGSGRADAARALLDWLVGPAGRELLAGFGFRPPAGT